MRSRRDNDPVNILGHRVDFSPVEFCQWVKGFQDQGATILGGGCETRPSHIREISQLKSESLLPC